MTEKLSSDSTDIVIFYIPVRNENDSYHNDNVDDVYSARRVTILQHRLDYAFTTRLLVIALPLTLVIVCITDSIVPFNNDTLCRLTRPLVITLTLLRISNLLCSQFSTLTLVSIQLLTTTLVIVLLSPDSINVFYPRFDSSGTHTLVMSPSITLSTLTFLLVINSESSIISRHYLFSALSSMTLSHIIHTKPTSTEEDPNERKNKERRTMTERLYRDSTNNCIFLVTMRAISLITLIMMMLTRTIILLLIIVNLIILDIAVIVRADVSSHNVTSHTGLTSTPHDTLNSTNYKSTDTILTLLYHSCFSVVMSSQSIVPVFGTSSFFNILLFYRIQYTCIQL